MATIANVIFCPGRVWRLEDLPARSIALDGAVQGPQIDAENLRYSFDHHGNCVRHASLATCEQVRDAILLGLDPRGFRLYINDIDADTTLSVWLLLHPLVLTEGDARRVRRLVHRIGRIDALGPGAGRAHPLHSHLSWPPDRGGNEDTLRIGMRVLDAWLVREDWRVLRELPEPPTMRAIYPQGGTIIDRPVDGGFRGLYRRADFGLVYSSAPGGSTAYTVGKRSEFVDFDVPGFLARCNAIEPGWGGASTIGGAPRHPDGSRSRLSPAKVAGLLRAATGTARES